MRTPFFVLSFLGSLLFFAAPALAATITLTPVADSYTLNTNASANVPYGTQDGMYATLASGPTFARAYVRFDLSAIPADATVQSAQLQLTLKSYSTTTPTQFSLQRVDAPWAEDTLTWNTQPSFSDTIQTQAVSYGNPETWDITTAAQHWIAGTWTNNGMLLKSTEGAGAQSTRGYWTREAATPSFVPTLTITYTGAAMPPVPALAVQNVTVSPDTTTATVSYTTTIAATSTVAYGATAAYGAQASNAATPALLHTTTLTGLLPAHTYHYQINAHMNGTSTQTVDSTFTTRAAVLTDTLGSGAAFLAKTNDASAVYYVDSFSVRHPFPNQHIYASWYPDFSTVMTISTAQMAGLHLGANVTYRPGVRMVKFQSLAKVYAVGPKGELRWISSEALATTLYGADWNKKIDDLSDAFFVNYHYGPDILSASDFVPATVTAAAPSIEGSW